MRNNSNSLTIRQILQIYNQRNPDKPLKSWKGSKQNLLEKIKTNRTIREAVFEFLYQEIDFDTEADCPIGLRYDEIYNLIHAEFPGCKTSMKGLRWYAAKFQQEFRDKRMPIRPRRPQRRGVNYDPATA